MKTTLAIVSGFVAMLATFAGGALAAVFFINAEPSEDRKFEMNTVGLWSNEPVTVKAAPKNLERLPARAAPPTPFVLAEPPSGDFYRDHGPESVDPMTTATVPAAPEAEMEAEPDTDLGNTAHVEWCLSRFRSYRPEDNTYTSYSGGRRACISPYSSTTSEEPVEYVEAAVTFEEPSGYLADDHVQSCFARYRSYRPEDNTYQPYGGGPRRICE